MNKVNVVSAVVALVIGAALGLSVGVNLGYAHSMRTWNAVPATSRLVVDLEHNLNVLQMLDAEDGAKLREHAALTLRVLTVQGASLVPYLEDAQREQIRRLVAEAEKLPGIFDASLPQGSGAVEAKAEILAAR